MRPGDIVFVRGDNMSPLSRLIRYYDKGEYYHVGIMLDDIHILDARLGGVKARHFDYVNYDIIRLDNVNINKATDYLGYKYDIAQFIYYGFRYGKVWNSPNKFICSELVAHAIGRTDLSNLTPNELYRKLRKEAENIGGVSNS